MAGPRSGFFRRLPMGPPQLSPLIKPLNLEEMKKGKRYPANAGLWTEEALAALHRFLRDFFHVQEGGLPAGQFTGTPTEIQAGEAAETGSPSTGWAPGLHKHSILTATAEALTPTSTNTEGDSSALARSDHTHDMAEVIAGVMSRISLGF